MSITIETSNYKQSDLNEVIQHLEKKGKFFSDKCKKNIMIKNHNDSEKFNVILNKNKFVTLNYNKNEFVFSIKDTVSTALAFLQKIYGTGVCFSITCDLINGPINEGYSFKPYSEYEIQGQCFYKFFNERINNCSQLMDYLATVEDAKQLLLEIYNDDDDNRGIDISIYDDNKQIISDRQFPLNRLSKEGIYFDIKNIEHLSDEIITGLSSPSPSEEYYTDPNLPQPQTEKKASIKITFIFEKSVGKQIEPFKDRFPTSTTIGELENILADKFEIEGKLKISYIKRSADSIESTCTIKEIKKDIRSNNKQRNILYVGCIKPSKSKKLNKSNKKELHKSTIRRADTNCLLHSIIPIKNENILNLQTFTFIFNNQTKELKLPKNAQLQDQIDTIRKLYNINSDSDIEIRTQAYGQEVEYIITDFNQKMDSFTDEIIHVYVKAKLQPKQNNALKEEPQPKSSNVQESESQPKSDDTRELEPQPKQNDALKEESQPESDNVQESESQPKLNDTRELEPQPKSNDAQELKSQSESDDTREPGLKPNEYYFKNNIDDKTYILEVSPKSTVKSFKRAISRQFKVSNLANIKILFAGKILLNNIILSKLAVGSLPLYVYIRSEEDIILMSCRALQPVSEYEYEYEYEYEEDQ